MRKLLPLLLVLTLAACKPSPAPAYHYVPYNPGPDSYAPSYAPPVVVVHHTTYLQPRRSFVIVRQMPAPRVLYVSPYRSYSGSASGGSFGGRRR